MLKTVEGTIQPRGWILEHLRRDKEGITGNLGKLCADAACGIFEDKKVKDEIDGCWSSWWPGETEGNWRDALTRLAFALRDEELLEDTRLYVDNILKHQGEDGYIGIFQPNERFGNSARSGELWTQSRIMLCLLTYYQNTGEERVFRALERLTDLIVTQYGPLANGRSLYQIPDEDGSKTHSLMIVEPILELYQYLNKPEYLAFCEFLYEDYSKYSVDAKFPCYDISSFMAANPRTPFVGHGPHTCEQLRIPLLLYKATKKPEYYTVFASAFEKLKRYLTLSGSCKSDELIGAYQGKISEVKKEGMDIGQCYPIPGIGYEYCSTTELMFSFTSALAYTGDLQYADYEEWMIMNAAMAARRQDGKAILYLCSDNLYKASKEVGDRWDYSPTHIDAAVCCAPNSCKVMPYHLSNMWQIDDEGSLHAIFYGPCSLETKLGDSLVTLEENTIYPFENKVQFKINCNNSFHTKLYFRIPDWCSSSKLSHNGRHVTGEVIKCGKGRALSYQGEFHNGDVLELEFDTQPRLIKAVDGTTAIAAGPLLYSLNIPAVAEDYYQYDLEPFCDTNYLPEKEAAWDFTLLHNEHRPEEYIRVCSNETEGFVWEQSPITLKAKMLSSWSIPEWVELVPIGNTILRRTTFPKVDDIYTSED